MGYEKDDEDYYRYGPPPMPPPHSIYGTPPPQYADQQMMGVLDPEGGAEDDLLHPSKNRPVRRRRSCPDKVCCGCCVCCPRWARYCSCFCLLVLVALGIVIGVLAALFKMPNVEMSGLESQPTVDITGGNTIQLGFQLQVKVDNPNVEGITFDSIVAKAFYPDHHDVQLGGGEKHHVVIAKKAISAFTFPFNLTIPIANKSYQAIFADLSTRCGLDGSVKQPISIDYDIIPTVKVGALPISFTISNSAHFDCPDVISHLDDLGSSSSSSFSALAAGD
ncbi:hypothetical protein [Absidia glauca]|uniref:Late embryogenesis abundant protein LEA-2 subgroup domain-containing protein n=1 Tax=Absidia glauca TaxID=4829 RepID=A0A168KVB2_ABSGL|nr:hypothetical protein [Absidia glauca]